MKSESEALNGPVGRRVCWRWPGRTYRDNGWPAVTSAPLCALRRSYRGWCWPSRRRSCLPARSRNIPCRAACAPPVERRVKSFREKHFHGNVKRNMFSRGKVSRKWRRFLTRKYVSAKHRQMVKYLVQITLPLACPPKIRIFLEVVISISDCPLEFSHAPSPIYSRSLPPLLLITVKKMNFLLLYLLSLHIRANYVNKLQ